MSAVGSIRGSTSGVEIATRAKKLGEQFRIGAGPAVDLGGVGRVVAVRAQLRLLVEGFGKRRLIVDALQSLDDDRVAALLRRIDCDAARALASAGVLHVLEGIGIRSIHVRPFDAEVRQRIERRGRIEIGRLGEGGRERTGQGRSRTSGRPQTSPRAHDLEPNRRS